LCYDFNINKEAIMSIKQIKLSLLILLGLIVSSYGFLIYAQENTATTGNVFTGESTATPDSNMTKDVARQVSTLMQNASGDNPEISMEQVRSLIDASLNQTSAADDISKIDTSQLKINKQNYNKLSSIKAKAKMKEDFTKYIASIFYIFSSNSPQPITSSKDISSVISSMTNSIASAVSQENLNPISELSASGKRISEQLKDVEIPEKMIDLHVKAIVYAKHAENLNELLAPNPDDPLRELSNLGQLGGFIESLAAFSDEINSKMDEYGIDFADQEIQTGLKKVGVPDLINNTDTEILSNTQNE